MLAENVNYDYDESSQPASDEFESTILIHVDNAVMRYLDLEGSQDSLRGVTIAKTDVGVEITGKGSRLQKGKIFCNIVNPLATSFTIIDILSAKEYIDSIYAEDLPIKKFGVYKFLMETSTRWQIEACQIENNCSIHIERMPDPEYGDDKFILLPKVTPCNILKLKKYFLLNFWQFVLPLPLLDLMNNFDLSEY